MARLVHSQGNKLNVSSMRSVLRSICTQVSNGAIDRAKSNLEEMVRRCAVLVDANTEPDLFAVQKKALLEVTYELTRQVTSPNDYLREEVCIEMSSRRTRKNTNWNLI